MNFQESLEIGKQAEQFAEKYFTKFNMKFKDVRADKSYQDLDVDYIVDGLGMVEVKQNFHEAKYGKKGKFFWIELQVENNQGWWNFTKADYFLFFNQDGNGIHIKNDSIFKELINNYIEHGDHSQYGNNRFDFNPDERTYGNILIKNMRVYLEDLENTNVKIQKVIWRRNSSHKAKLQ
jgi:hypothetical protein